MLPRWGSPAIAEIGPGDGALRLGGAGTPRCTRPCPLVNANRVLISAWNMSHVGLAWAMGSAAASAASQSLDFAWVLA